MSHNRLPFTGKSGSKTAGPPISSPSLQRPHQTSCRKNNQHPQTSSSSSSHPAPCSVLLSDNTMTPWGGLAHAESSFTMIPPALPPPRPPPLPPPLPPVPQPTPTAPHGRQEDEEHSSSSFSSEIPSPCLVVSPNDAGLTEDGVKSGVCRDLRMRRRLLPQRRVPRPPRLPPLRPITNLSFSRSFTFSFFELPLHHSPYCRAERIRNLFQLLKQIHY